MSGKKIVVIGGGASGLMAAGSAAEHGGEVVVLEKMKTAARKLRITGKGRCNLTNTAELAEFIGHFGKTGRFLRQSFGSFFAAELIEFLACRGLGVVYERGGRVFPAASGAPAVAQLLLDWLKEKGATVKTGAAVSELIIRGGRVAGAVCNGRTIEADRVILATGGASYPRTGSTGDGYRLAAGAGHRLVPCRPALVPLKTGSEAVAGLDGLSLKNVNARLYINGKRRLQEFGELTFTPDGLSGPVILTLSLAAVDGLAAQQRVAVSVDLKPALDDKKLEARLRRDLEGRGREPMADVLRGLLPRQLVPYCLRQVEIVPEQPAAQLRAETRTRLRLWLKDLRFEITGCGSYDEAIITAGGVDTAEIDPRTMESRRTAGLYIVGELLDIQADTGGYNLQAAFSTGWLAGRAAAS